MDIVKDFFDFEEKIYRYFGFSNENDQHPIFDMRDYFWIKNNEVVRYNDTKESAIFDYYEREIRTVENNTSCVEGYTMVAVKQENTNYFELMIFNNKKMISLAEYCKDDNN